jgi:hypothetical protein
MKTNITFLSWAGGRPWIVSSTPCTRTSTVYHKRADQRSERRRTYLKEERRAGMGGRRNKGKGEEKGMKVPFDHRIRDG